MTTWASPYQGAYLPCSGTAQPGTIALWTVVSGLFPRTYNLGIYNCRKIAGTDIWSVHSDGRAWDCGVPMIGGAPDHALGDPIQVLLARHAVALGIQQIIWAGRVWSATHPDGAPFPGHEDHLHIEQQWYEAQNLSVAEIAAILRDGHEGEGGGTPIEEDEDDMPRYIKITGDPNTYGYSDSSWWVVTLDEEPGSFGQVVREVNARQRDVIRSRVLNNGKERAEAGLGDGNLAAIGAVVRREATDANARGLQTYLAGLPNAEFDAERVAAIKAEGARGGVLAELFAPTQPEGE